MSFGGGYQGGRTKMGTKVILNIYDLTPANEYLYSVGFGLHHSGVEIMGSEYSFAGGGGIFESSPKEAPGAKFRESVEMGAFDGGSSELRAALDDLRSDFGAHSYNLIFKNCNHFANALCWTLLRKPIPGYVNRLANYGQCMSCLLPRKMLENAPVGPNDGDEGGDNASGFQMYPGRSSGASTASRSTNVTAFSGGGTKLGSSSTEASTSSTASGIGSRLFGSASASAMSSESRNTDDLTDRREKARKAALARLERNATENGNGGSATPQEKKSD